jgi:hypothetical protein
VGTTSPYDLLDPAKTYVDSTVTQMAVKGIKAFNSKITYAALHDRTILGFWLATIDTAGTLLGASIQYKAVLYNQPWPHYLT